MDSHSHHRRCLGNDIFADITEGIDDGCVISVLSKKRMVVISIFSAPLYLDIIEQLQNRFIMTFFTQWYVRVWNFCINACFV